jgi:hypothetical protein
MGITRENEMNIDDKKWDLIESGTEFVNSHTVYGLDGEIVHHAVSTVDADFVSSLFFSAVERKQDGARMRWTGIVTSYAINGMSTNIIFGPWMPVSQPATVG